MEKTQEPSTWDTILKIAIFFTFVALGITSCRVVHPPPITYRESAGPPPALQSAPDSMLIVSPQAPIQENPYEELTVEKARREGVLAGEYDALLHGPEAVAVNSDGCLEIQFTLLNVGTSSDAYHLSVSKGVDRVEPGEIKLDSQGSQTILATVCDLPSENIVLEVYSQGRGDRVASYKN